MRYLPHSLLAALCAATLLTQAQAQPPGRRQAEEPAREKKDYSDAPIVKRLMAFDKNKDGKLTRDEITDERLLRLFDMADTNKDGIVTKEELVALAAKLDAEAQQDDRRGRGGPGGPDGPGGPGGPGGRGPGGRGPGGPPAPGQILPPFMQEQLNLTDDQKKQLAELQKEVEGKLDKILTADQKKQLKEMRDGFGRRGPGGPGGPGGRGQGGPGGPGGRGPGGPPPGGPDGPPPGGEGGRPPS